MCVYKNLPELWLLCAVLKPEANGKINNTDSVVEILIFCSIMGFFALTLIFQKIAFNAIYLDC